MKQCVITFLLAFISITGWGQTKVWDEVVQGYGNSSYLTITKVAIWDTRTEVFVHVQFIKGQWIRVNENTVLRAGGKDYKVKQTTVFELGQQYTLPSDEVDFVVIFEPLPVDTKSFDFVEPDGWLMTNIRNAADTPEGINDTYWRDSSTGDWLIGFAEKHVIYNNKVWDIVGRTEKKDAYVLTLNDGTPVKVGKMKNGTRTIAIGNAKPIVCSPITGAVLPDYPMKDTRTGFVDNGYDPTDSVTIIGWLKDMPPQAWGHGKEFEVAIENIISGNQENTYTVMDSLGRFSFRMSLMNSTEVFIDWGRSTVQTFLEPGKTYFFLNDFKTGQKLWMGDDVRVQNELMAHKRSRAEAKVPQRPDIDLMAYWAQADSARQVQMDYHQALQQSHPTLSQRYLDYVADYYRMDQATNMLEAQIYVKGFQAPQEYREYLNREFWHKPPKPYTIYRDFGEFMHNHLNFTSWTRVQENFITTFKRFAKEGLVTLTPEEQRALDDYPEEVKRMETKTKDAQTDEERKAIAEAFNSSETVATMNALLKRCSSLVGLYAIQQIMDVADSLGCEQSMRDIILAHQIYQLIDGNREAEDSVVMAFAQQQIKMPAALNIVKELNNKYLALQQRDMSKSSNNQEAMSDGEKILRKLIEPYKGRLILLDIWGVWCGPCREALSHSQEEYERLKDFDIVFLYLANQSEEAAWRNVIKEYNVVGDNVVHYNLPVDQQSAIEHFLGVSAWPHYRLIDRDGNVLDVNADPRDLEGLARLLRQMQ